VYFSTDTTSWQTRTDRTCELCGNSYLGTWGSERGNCFASLGALLVI